MHRSLRGLFRAGKRQPTPEGVRALQEVGLSLRSYALLNVVVDKVFQLVWFVVGALIFWRRSDDWMALLVSVFLVSFGTVTVDPTDADALVSSQPAWWLPVQGVQILGEVCAPLSSCCSPTGASCRAGRAGSRLRPLPTMPPTVSSLVCTPCRLPWRRFHFWCSWATVVILIWAQIYRYRKVSSPTQRRQTKWVIFGTALGVAGTFPLQLPVDLALVSGDTPLALLVLKAGFALSFLLVPLSIGVAVLRSRLFDVDVLINRTLVYGSLTALLVLAYLGGVTASQAIVQTLTGQEELPQLAIVASTLVIAALFNPLRRRTQSFIDQRFYRRKYDARKTLEAFSVRLRDETDLNGLREDLVGVVGETVQPAHVSVWLRPDTTPLKTRRTYN